MKLRLRYFASLRETLGKSHEEFETHASSVAEVRDELLARGDAYLCLARGKAVRMALNQVMVADERAQVTDNAELAFFPPVTGG
jgi:molybdopterin synthase sulfur carrier subunit